MNKCVTIYYEKQNNQLVKYNKLNNRFYLISKKKNNTLLVYFLAILIVVLYSTFKDVFSIKFDFLTGIFIMIGLFIIIVYMYEQNVIVTTRGTDSETMFPVDVVKYLPSVKIQVFSEVLIFIMGLIFFVIGIILYNISSTFITILINLFGLFLLYLELIHLNLIMKLFVINKLKRREFNDEGLV